MNGGGRWVWDWGWEVTVTDGRCARGGGEGEC